MPASPKQARAPAKSPAKSVKAAPKPSSQPYLRFYHSKALRTRTLAVLNKLEKAKDPTEHREALAGIVEELTDSGMDYYFLRPLKLADVGFFVEQSANLGMSATTRLLGSVIHGIIGRMDTPQLLVVSNYIRELMK
jgi:hypothetical protein